jgi:DNA polymerase-1
MTQFAMLQIRAEMKKHNLRSVLVGQVHDSIIIDSPPQETSFCGQLLHECMTKRTQAAYPVLRIPLKADVTCGPSYGEQDLSINETGEITRHS